MKNKLRYGTVTFATNMLRKAGFDKDFYFFNNAIVCDQAEFKANDLDIVVVYRYEGIIDSADQVSVYGLKSTSGIKGIFIAGDGIYCDAMLADFLKQMHLKKDKSYQMCY